MRSAHALGQLPSLSPDRRGRSRASVWLLSHLRAPWLDQELAAGVASWRSALHAARALQLISARSRQGLARSLEGLAELCGQSASVRSGSVVPPCREQVRQALPQIMAISSRLRSAEPVDARGVARLQALLCDGGGPCYSPAGRIALVDGLDSVSQCLDVAD